MFRILSFVALSLTLASGCDSLHARMLAQEAVNLYHKSQLNEAAEKFEQAAKLDPYIPAIQLDLGFANLAIYQAQPKSPLGQSAASKSVIAFERYLQLRPDEERARVFLVQTFVDTSRYDEAVAFFKPQVEKTPPDGDALNTLGLIASKTGKYEEAKSWYERRVLAEPQNSDARLSLGVLMWDYLHSHAELVGDDRVALSDVAIGHLAEAIKIRPKAPNAYLYTNLVYRERAAGEIDDDHKRVDLEEANKFFRIANEMTKGGK